MTDEQRFEQFIELCKRIYERMEHEGAWPWPEDDPGQELEGEEEIIIRLTD